MLSSYVLSCFGYDVPWNWWDFWFPSRLFKSQFCVEDQLKLKSYFLKTCFESLLSVHLHVSFWCLDLIGEEAYLSIFHNIWSFLANNGLKRSDARWYHHCGGPTIKYHFGSDTKLCPGFTPSSVMVKTCAVQGEHIWTVHNHTNHTIAYTQICDRGGRSAPPHPG